LTWAWDFGDPASTSANTSAIEAPAHLYAAFGNYRVTLTVTDPEGYTDSDDATITIAP
jgi:PKD repeat protein